MDIKAVILASNLFDSGHVQIDFKVCLIEMGYSVLKLREIFSTKPFKIPGESMKTLNA